MSGFLGFWPFLLAIGLQTSPMTPPTSPIPTGSRQMIRVLSTHWSAVPASLQRYERSSDTAPWQAVGTDIPVVLGKKGMGWGRGLHNPADALNGDFRKEGDKRAPAGVFSLGTVFGLATPKRSLLGSRCPTSP